MQKTAEQDPYVSLARIQVREWVTKRNRIDVPDGLPAEMLERQAGVFVSIHEHGDLRGCIGTIAPTRDNIAKEIIYNAISACSKDPRFTPIREDELPYLDISVDVLGETEPVLDRSQLDVKRYGVICSKGYQRGLLLPNLEGVDTVEDQIAIACRKGGIDPDDEELMLERFEVIRHV